MHEKPRRSPLSRRRRGARLAWPAIAVALAACGPEVGSERWCKEMGQTPKNDWTAADEAAYDDHCMFELE